MESNTSEKLTKQELLTGAQRDLLRCEEKLRLTGFMALRELRTTLLLSVGEIEDVAAVTKQTPQGKRIVEFCERMAG